MTSFPDGAERHRVTLAVGVDLEHERRADALSLEVAHEAALPVSPVRMAVDRQLRPIELGKRRQRAVRRTVVDHQQLEIRHHARDLLPPLAQDGDDDRLLVEDRNHDDQLGRPGRRPAAPDLGVRTRYAPGGPRRKTGAGVGRLGRGRGKGGA